jgi:serine O-acetyltransferase
VTAPAAEVVQRLSATDRAEADRLLRALATSGCW